MLRRLIQPWVLYRFRDGGAEVTLVWRNRLSLFVVLLLLLVELFSPSRVSMTLLLTFASVTAVAAWWAWHMAQGVRVRRGVGARLRGPLRRFRWLGWGQRLGGRIGGGGEI